MTAAATASSSPSLDQKIGHLLIVGFEGKSIKDPEVQKTLSYVKEGTLGGVIFYRRNIDTIAQVTSLTQKMWEAVPAGSPFFISVDQEGGRVQRLLPLQEGRSYPSAAYLCSLSPEERRALSADMAQWLVFLGFNLNFAPVVDLHKDESNVIGALGRAFSENPQQVADCAWDVIKGFHRHGLLSCVKHFPGHGLVLEDSHKGWVDASDVASHNELLPYEILMKKQAVDMVMTAHVFNRHQDPHHPATLSPTTIERLLRKKMGYDGVVVSDDLHMGGILQHYPIEEAIVSALNAGCDLIILSNNPASAVGVPDFKPDVHWPERFIAIVKAAIAQGKLSEERIDQAYGRIQKLWRSMGRREIDVSLPLNNLPLPLEGPQGGGGSPVEEL